jgi:hypothetical protein
VRAGLSPNMQDVRNLLRHSAAVHMAEYGVSVDEIGQILGHTNSKVAYRVCAVFAELPETITECVGMTVAFNVCYDRLEILTNMKEFYLWL